MLSRVQAAWGKSEHNICGIQAKREAAAAAEEHVEEAAEIKEAEHQAESEAAAESARKKARKEPLGAVPKRLAAPPPLLLPSEQVGNAAAVAALAASEAVAASVRQAAFSAPSQGLPLDVRAIAQAAAQAAAEATQAAVENILSAQAAKHEAEAEAKRLASARPVRPATARLQLPAAASHSAPRRPLVRPPQLQQMQRADLAARVPQLSDEEECSEDVSFGPQMLETLDCHDLSCSECETQQ